MFWSRSTNPARSSQAMAVRTLVSAWRSSLSKEAATGSEPGMSAWITRRTSALSIPMPKALVAQMTRIDPSMNPSWTWRFAGGASPAWKAAASHPCLCR